MQTTTRPLKAGDRAPRFSLPSFPTGTATLDDFAGKKNVILAFYPKDNTPGCTKEMCAFSEELSKFESADTVVLGISCDSVTSHEKFATKFALKQTLLADTGGVIARQFGVVAEGKSTASRVLFIIDKLGVIRYVHEGMPKNDVVLAEISKLG